MITAIQQIIATKVPAYHKGLTGDIKGMRIALNICEGVDAGGSSSCIKNGWSMQWNGNIVEKWACLTLNTDSAYYHRFIWSIFELTVSMGSLRAVQQKQKH